jgi:hypothetical protein
VCEHGDPPDTPRIDIDYTSMTAAAATGKEWLAA